MHGLPTGFDTSPLIGCELEAVSFSVNTIHFSFSDEVSITIELSFAHAIDGNLDHSTREYVPVRESRLMQLVGESIESAEASPDGTLSLRFTNGQALAFYDETPQYEAYRINLGGEEIIV